MQQQPFVTQKETSKFLSELLMVIVLLFHLVDVLGLGSSIDPGPIGIRVAMYLAIVIATLFIKGDFSKPEIIKYLIVAAIPAIAIPLLAYTIRLFGASPDTMQTIAGYALLVPIYAIFLLSSKDLDYTLAGETPLQKFILLFFQPSFYLKLYLTFLAFLLFVLFIASVGSMARGGSDVLGIYGSGFQAEDAISGAAKIVSAPFRAIGDLIRGVGDRYDTLMNESLGTYYVGHVEENRERTGVFIRRFEEIGNYFEGQRVDLLATIETRSFLDNINLTPRCYTQDPRNQSRIINGTVNPEKVLNVYRDDYRVVSCTFEQDKLAQGRYDVTFELDFNFETWSYVTLTFMDRDYVLSQMMSKEQILSKYNINPRIRAIYTSGPVALGMHDAMEMPITLTTEHDNIIPLGLTIDARPEFGMRGEILNIETFEIRAPREFVVEERNCVIPQGARLTTTIDNRTGYNIHKFNVSNTPGTYTTVSCTSVIPPDNVMQLLGAQAGKREVTIAGSTKYDYRLIRRASILVRPTI